MSAENADSVAKPLTREQGIDVIWSAVMVAVPISSDEPATEADRVIAKGMFAATVAALQALGVSVVEIDRALDRWKVAIEAGN